MAIETTTLHLDRNVLSAPLPLLGRTPRELACLAVGGWTVACALGEPRGAVFWLNLGLAVGGTLLFLVRFHLARLAATAAGFAAGAQWWIGHADALANPLDMDWRAYACVAAPLVLASSDLVKRFDRGRTFRWWPNPWRHLGRADYATLRWSLYLLFVLGALILKGYVDYEHLGWQARVGWVHTHTAGLVVVSVLLAFGVRPAVLLLPLMHLWTLLEVLPGPAPAGQTLLAPPAIFFKLPHVAQPALVIAIAGTVLSTILAVRYVTRRLELTP